MRKFLLVLAALAPSLSARAQSSGLIWTGDFELGSSSFTGHCSASDSQWCATQTIRSAQITAVQSPSVQGRYAARFEVKYGDVYSTYSDSRSLMTGPTTLWEDAGNERWYRWQAMWPADWVGSYPKWDELSNPDARSPAGSLVEWHHEPFGGGIETGSAPLYIGADDSYIWLCLVDQATSTCRYRPNLIQLVRGHWHDFVLHAKWSPSASVGFLEIWIDGVLVQPKLMTATMYPNTRNYLSVGLYRNGHIGDPNLLWPNGTHVYGTDGTPGVAYLDGFVAGTTQASVLAELPWGPQPEADAGTPDAGPADAGPADAGAAPPPPVDAGSPSADAGTPPEDPGTPDAGAVLPVPPVPPVTPDAGTTVPVKPTGIAALGYPGGGCSSGGAHYAWLSLPWLVLLFLRKKRRQQTAGNAPAEP